MGISIMIVDDDRDDIDIFIEAVDALDLSIHCATANNGLVGLNMLHALEQKPDYIFVDLNMPKINGKQFVAEVRKNSMFDKIKLVIYSTSRPDGNHLFGADEFITKPTTQEELSLAIEKVISHQHHETHG